MCLFVIVIPGIDMQFSRKKGSTRFVKYVLMSLKECTLDYF